jgi:hypothetical protein
VGKHQSKLSSFWKSCQVDVLLNEDRKYGAAKKDDRKQVLQIGIIIYLITSS